MTAIPGASQNIAGIVTGAAIGLGVGVAAQVLFGNNQHKADSWNQAGKDKKQFESERKALQNQLADAEKKGTMSISEHKALTSRIKDLTEKIEDRDWTSKAWSKNWTMALAVPAAIGAPMLWNTLDHSNWVWHENVINPGSDWLLSIDRKVEWEKVSRNQFTFKPGFAAGVAGGIAAGFIGARLVQSFTSRPND